MPTIDSFNGIKIHVYNGDHRPPHIHVNYNEFEVIIEIESYAIYAGSIPGKQLRQVFSWLKLNNEWALNVFFELNPELK